MLTPDVIALAERSVLCWLATVDEQGQPNVSPKEIFCLLPPASLTIANIASPTSVRNIQRSKKVCVSFVDVFVQKGYKVIGSARVVLPGDADYASRAQPLQTLVGMRFRIHSVIEVDVTAVEPIVAPSYRIYPAETTEEQQVLAAMRTYGVRPASGLPRARSRRGSHSSDS